MPHLSVLPLAKAFVIFEEQLSVWEDGPYIIFRSRGLPGPLIFFSFSYAKSTLSLLVDVQFLFPLQVCLKLDSTTEACSLSPSLTQVDLDFVNNYSSLW